MDQTIYLITLVATVLILAAAFSSLIAFRYGAPLLLLFLGIGLMAGQDGFGLVFDNAPLAYFVGSLALAVILFDSGFSTPVSMFRQAASPALTLATFGVIITTLIFGTATYYLTDFNWLESFLLGACVSSTDAAAVFFLLRAGNLTLRDRVRSTLEVESGTNDPIAIFLTLTLVHIISIGNIPETSAVLTDIVVGFLRSMGVGIIAGFIGGHLIVRLINELKLDTGLLPIFALALSLLLFAATGTIGGSGFLAVYIAGLVAGNTSLRGSKSLERFQAGMSWLAQIIMFLVLGLYATPSQFVAILPVALVLGVFLIFIARPIAVSLSLVPFRFSRTENAFLSFVGLRGSVSILLALTPVINGLENGPDIFNIAFIVVLVSLIVQGWSIGPLARRLSLLVPPRSGPLEKVELELPGSAHHELLTYTVVPGSPVTRGERIPRWARPSLVVRDGKSMKLNEYGRLIAGDRVYIFVHDRYPRLLDRLFASPAEVDPEDEDFFGTFTIDPNKPAAILEQIYGIELRPEHRDLTIAALMRRKLEGFVEYGDRLPLQSIELIVRDVDENGEITALGLSVDPPAPPPSVPVYVSLNEALDRLRIWINAKRQSRG
ncbi:potassium/proton antiporter [Limoniibacter endophyticus]|uniref:K+/H+ antiporter n=1 Tax=Limoniibacter endophyticus TaxID=1565040 RepID=A0A8J3DS87_9HYPH|nr:potassium/proton antiporter [Limoniibacter endophyticus]GHC77122.1 K+/H+ antiporter [Limoniibacter endophyticus]